MKTLNPRASFSMKPMRDLLVWIAQNPGEVQPRHRLLVEAYQWDVLGVVRPVRRIDRPDISWHLIGRNADCEIEWPFLYKGKPIITSYDIITHRFQGIAENPTFLLDTVEEMSKIPWRMDSYDSAGRQEDPWTGFVEDLDRTCRPEPVPRLSDIF